MGVFHLGIAGDGDVSLGVVIAAADACACTAAGGFLDHGVTGDDHRGVAVETAAANARAASGVRVVRGAAPSRDIAARDGHHAVSAATTAANACTVLLSSGGDGAAGDLEGTGIFDICSADPCAAEAAGGVQTAVLVLILNGQLAADHVPVGVLFLVPLQARVPAAAFQRVAAVQLNGGVAGARDAHGCCVTFWVRDGNI